jgi:hypothetical protein
VVLRTHLCSRAGCGFVWLGGANYNPIEKLLVPVEITP